MQIFEVHITGDENIIEETNKIGIKNITIDLLKPDNSFFRTEYMTSFVHKETSLHHCRNWIINTLLPKLYKKVAVKRVKIETPVYEEYIPKSLYIEAHFEANSCLFPMSKNQNKTKILATDRRYNKDLYADFIKLYNFADIAVELCVWDTYVDEDKDWFDLYR